MDFTLILLLIGLNAIFALSEMAVVASRSARLQQLEDEARPGAAAAVALRKDPARFLSSIQIGITAVGVLAGAVGETVLAEPLAKRLAAFPLLAPHAVGLAFTVTVVLITYLSVVLGELVPKRLALLGPERIALLIATPMTWLARIAAPLVWILSRSSDLVLALVPRRAHHEPPVTDEEITVLMEQGAAAGVFHESEQTYVSNVLRLDDRRVTSISSMRWISTIRPKPSGRGWPARRILASSSAVAGPTTCSASSRSPSCSRTYSADGRSTLPRGCTSRCACRKLRRRPR